MSTIEELTDQLERERRLRAMRDALDVNVDEMIAAVIACRRTAAKEIRRLRVSLHAEMKKTARRSSEEGGIGEAANDRHEERNYCSAGNVDRRSRVTPLFLFGNKTKNSLLDLIVLISITRPRYAAASRSTRACC